MRCDQFMGLSPKANAIIQNRPIAYTKKITHVFPDGTEQEQSPENILVSKVEYSKFYGMFDQQHGLYEYQLNDGRVVQEFIQAEPWSCGPVFFLALRDKNTGEIIKETLWPEEEINNC